jgi:orotate phosphoribosyltransferase
MTGHFVLSSGRHADKYLQAALALQYPEEADAFGFALARALNPHTPSVVISPAVGGLIIGQTTAAGLGVRAVFAERGDAGFTMRRGFSLSPTDRVAVVDDVYTTGRSVREVIAAVYNAGAVPAVVGAIVDRSAPDLEALPIPLVTIARLDVPSWAPEECPMCERGVPLEKPGSRPV